MKKYLLSIACLALYTSVSNAAQIKEIFYNPKPLSDDVVVSMPCDMKMVFRKVYTSYDNERIKDKSFRAGGEQNTDLISESLNTRYVQGSFKDKKGYYYLLGKYELSALQYQVLTDEKCPKATVKGRMPAVNISYFDAQRAAANYSLYLQNAKDAPKADGVAAFARMVTDSEFEFAVRGGLVSSQAQFDAMLPPMEGSLNDYAVYQGVESANGKISPIGTRKGNVLGLFDLFGNANEMMHDLFHATRTGRLHGQGGGFTVRGGSFLTAADEMSSAYRKERSFFIKGKENKSRDMSTRLVLSLPVISSLQSADALNAEIKKLGYDSDEKDSRGGNLKTVESLDKIIANNKKTLDENKKLILKGEKDLKDEKALSAKLKERNSSLSEQIESMGSALSALKQDMVKANAARDEMRDRAIASNIRIGALMCSIVSDYKKSEVTAKKRLDLIKDMADKDESYKESYKKAKAQHEAFVQDLKMVSDTYGSLIAMTQSSYDLPLVKQQLSTAGESLGALSDNKMFAQFINNFYSDLLSYSKDRKKDLKKNEQKWIEGCFKTGSAADK
ncbi:Formylglycine-generating sulfatase enzyme [Anaerobiospirillum thomasii]|uniref:SUMF1/EgtB/PvdO family nonheme iron enzyme n=1 Tax=Anaerobiospirillum thomasii TaxID=179995 RepID=UPI000D910EA1|nr:SUMF1/EgtB/PvdO family nonheme iron enzyme [Anaerobiospirillum thomasii]SPT71327.1 Formylglycine-generating sulfatase enzyme [Anaerobiospirillum thomasii]